MKAYKAPLRPVKVVREADPTEWPLPLQLVRAGGANLSVDQLLSVVAGCSVEQATKMLGVVSRELNRLSQVSGVVHMHYDGVGQTGAARIVAALELGKRLAAESRDPGAPLRSPRDVVSVLSPKMQDLPVEEFHVLILDAQHRMQHDVLITRGLLNSSLVHPREVFREAIAHRAAAVILVHNHPSGDPTPSPEDRSVTEQLVAAGRLLDLPVHDHIIIGKGRYVSFAETGLI